MKELKLTPEDAIDLICNDHPLYKILEEYVVKADLEDFEWTYDYIFEEIETGDQYSVTINIGNITSNLDWDESFLENCIYKKIDFFYS